MQAKRVKIILVTAVISFFSAGISIAQDWKSNSPNTPRKSHKQHGRDLKGKEQKGESAN